MMKIAICDDEKEFRDLIRVYIEDYLNTKDILYAIDTFDSGEMFLCEGESLPENSIIFLDTNTTCVEECLDAVLDKREPHTARKKFTFKEGQTEVLFNHILYIESKLHKLEFHIIENGKVRIYTRYGTMNDLEAELKSYHFIRVHQSYLVNLQHIRQVSRYEVTLHNGDIISIPKARYKEVEEAFTAYKY